MFSTSLIRVRVGPMLARSMCPILSSTSNQLHHPINTSSSCMQININSRRLLSTSPETDTDTVMITKSTPVTAFLTTPSLTTKLAALHSKLHSAEAAIHLRITVDAGGCSGFTYDFKVSPHNETTYNEAEDLCITPPDSKSKTEFVVTDLDSLEYLKGCTIDYKEEMIRSAFAVVDNPLAESACGCGSSFALKNFGDTVEALKH
jgi:iron-sulfur cluster assembly accessory protein